MRVVRMNLHHVKKSKEMDDDNPNKNDRKDPKTIAGEGGLTQKCGMILVRMGCMSP